MTDYSDRERMLALASLTTGIYVLTVRDGDRRHGMSSSWVTQVSGTPRLLIAAVDQRHRTHEVLIRTGTFALNVVGRRGRFLEDYFYSAASRQPDNLGSMVWEDSPAGLPYLLYATVNLECRVTQQHAAGDHTLFVAEVTHSIQRDGDTPLTSLDLDYVYVGEVIRR
jgi:flavin reductase (DIM6/NTAB) family NADH-FMN oxidoreductase RutF